MVFDSLDEQYKSLCAELKVKPNSAVVTYLSNKSPDEIVEWDLTGNVVGTKGAGVIAKFAAQTLPNLERINFTGNNLGSPATEDLYKAFVSHPRLHAIILNQNDIRLGGPALVELVKKNKRITTLEIQGTFLRPLFERLIAINLENNRRAVEKGQMMSTSKKQAKFTFGESDPDHDSAFAAGEEDAFAGFGKLDTGNHVSFNTDATGGKKVKRRPTVSSEVIRDDDIDNFVPQRNEKSEVNRQWLLSVLERHDLFSHLEDRELLVCVDAAVECERCAGDTIFCEGDEDGDLFYIVGSGEVELLVDDEVVKTLKKGDTTQDLMLLYSGTYRETARCATDTRLYSLDRMTYKCVLSQASKKKRAMYEGFLSSVEKFKCLTRAELLQLADALKPAVYEPGAKLIKYGEDGLTFFLIVEGVVEVYGRNEQGESIKVCEFKEGDCVGELEFLNDHKCVADVVAKDTVRTAKMNRHHFEMVMGPVKELLARTANESEVYSYYRETLNRMQNDASSPTATGE